MVNGNAKTNVKVLVLVLPIVMMDALATNCCCTSCRCQVQLERRKEGRKEGTTMNSGSGEKRVHVGVSNTRRGERGEWPHETNAIPFNRQAFAHH